MLIVIAALLLVCVLGAARWLIAGDIGMLVKLARYGLLGMALLALGLLLLSGRLSPFFIGLLACLPLIKTFQGLWQETASKFNSDSSGFFTREIDRDLALTILGVLPNATPEEIKAAHKRLIQKMHPDKGGSAYLAQEINRARDMLLG